MMNAKPLFSLIQTKRGSASLESIISVSIFSLLIIIGGLIFLQQFRYDEEKFNALVMQPGVTVQTTDTTSGEKDYIEIAGLEPKDFIPMSERESFDQYTLSDKINGKADGYLDSGFFQLVCRRFIHSSDNGRWFEFFLYDMALPRNAFSVYSKQKREGVTDHDFTEFAYSTENAVFFVHGQYYVEIISAVEDESLIGDMIFMSKRFIDKIPGSRVELPELDYLPFEDLDPGSISLILKNGFGFKDLNNVFMGRYRLDGHNILAFLSLRETADEARSLAMAYDNFISEFIGPERIKPDTDQIPGLTIGDLFGEYEIFFVKGNVFAGVHAASDKGLGEEIALRVYKRISELVK